LRDAVAADVQIPEPSLSLDVTLLSRLPIPKRGLTIILGHSFALFIHQPQAALRFGVATSSLLLKGSEALFIEGLG
jgi:hypothetical protein